jgi:tetratricopeptide (TPR) repeat protein
LLQGDLGEARAHLRDAAVLCERLGEAESRFSVRLDEASVHTETAEFAAALKDLQEAAAAGPAGLEREYRAHYFIQRGETLARLGMSANALSSFKEAVSAAGDGDDVWARGARTWYKWGIGSSEMVTALREDVEHYGATGEGWWHLLSRYLVADLLMRYGRFDEAIECLALSEDVDADSVAESFGVLRAPALLLRGRAHEGRTDCSAALTDYMDALALASGRSQKDEQWQAEALSGLLMVKNGERSTGVVKLKSSLATIAEVTSSFGSPERSAFLCNPLRASLLSRIAEVLR